MGQNTQEANSVEVEIFGQAFNVGTVPECGIDPGYALRLAKYVDSKVRFVADKNPHVTDCASLVVLAALNIADENQRLKAKLDGGEKETSSGEMRLMTEENKTAQNRERRQRHYTRAGTRKSS